MENAKGAICGTADLMAELALIKHDLTVQQEKLMQVINDTFFLKKKLNEVIACLNRN